MKTLLISDAQLGQPGAGDFTGQSPAPAPAISTADKIKAIEAELGAGLTLAANISGAIDPALIPFIVIGKAAAAAVPGIVDDVTAMIEGGAPSPEDNVALAQKIAGLNSPENL